MVARDERESGEGVCGVFFIGASAGSGGVAEEKNKESERSTKPQISKGTARAIEELRIHFEKKLVRAFEEKVQGHS
ncbi:hypothetical protein HAX54_025703 [Datura stramonium]|uniref:Uncharacterized protein n=1 Tax=Datura stramonium TaxID=4076 RepID=A0ABS8V2T1_DATST|nr:hypothetical protein [Datura stramonium]